MKYKNAFTPSRTTLGKAPDQTWLIHTNISEFADRASEAGLLKLEEKLARIYGDLELSEVYWKGDRWRMDITHESEKEASASLGWIGRKFMWVVDSEGGYRQVGKLKKSEPSQMATLEMFDAIREWRKQVVKIQEHKEQQVESRCAHCGGPVCE